MHDPNWTGPFRAEGRWVHDADGSIVCLVAACADDEYRAAAIAHALNRLPVAEAEIERMRVALALFIGPYEAELAEKKAKFDRYIATPWCAARLRITERAFVDGLAALKGQIND